MSLQLFTSCVPAALHGITGGYKDAQDGIPGDLPFPAREKLCTHRMRLHSSREAHCRIEFSKRETGFMSGFMMWHIRTQSRGLGGTGTGLPRSRDGKVSRPSSSFVLGEWEGKGGRWQERWVFHGQPRPATLGSGPLIM